MGGRHSGGRQHRDENRSRRGEHPLKQKKGVEAVTNWPWGKDPNVGGRRDGAPRKRKARTTGSRVQERTVPEHDAENSDCQTNRLAASVERKRAEKRIRGNYKARREASALREWRCGSAKVEIDLTGKKTTQERARQLTEKRVWKGWPGPGHGQPSRPWRQ